MQIRALAALTLIGMAGLGSAPAIGAAPPILARANSSLPRHANVVADAAGRSMDEALRRQQFHGTRPVVTPSQPMAVNREQILAYGFRNVRPNASGILVQVSVHDTTGQYQDCYVYDAQTHFVKYQIENVILPNGAHSSAKKRN